MSYQTPPNPVTPSGPDKPDELDKHDKRSQRSAVFDASRLGWLGCSWFEKFGPKSLAKLHSKFGPDGGDKAWKASLDEYRVAGLTEETAAAFCAWRSSIKPDDLADRLLQCGIDFYLPWDKSYPAILRQTSSPPGALFWRGATVFDSTRPWIAVVGTRSMTSYGKRATEMVVGELVERGAGIVSGLALGVDACAHSATLDAGGCTVAVLGSGLDADSIYPRANAALAERILLSGGALMSEYPPGAESIKHHFPLRNRLIAGLCRATVVVEAGEKSGSVLTAKLALDENREVFAVPGPITSPTSKGTNELLRQGAQPCTCGADVLNGTVAEPPANAAMMRPLTEEETRLLDLCRTATHVDELTRLLDSNSPTVTATCMGLELMNAIQDVGGQTYELTSYGRKLMNQKN